MTRRVPVMERLLSRITVDDNGCWLYPTTNENGYGVIGMGGRGGRTRRSHRVAYESLVGPVPDGMELDHLCRNRACCNPAHLEPVDRATNVQRGVRKTQQTECKRGHELAGDNLLVTKQQRVCLTCKRAAARKYAQRQREEKQS